MHCLVFTDTDLYSLTKGKSYLANQRWRRSTCLRDQRYDAGCHPCRGAVQIIWHFNVLHREMQAARNVGFIKDNYTENVNI